MDFIGKVFDFLKLPWHISLALVFGFTLVLAAPSSMLAWFSLEGFVTTYRPWISLGLIVSFVVLAAHFFHFIGVGAGVWIENFRIQQKGRKRLQNLTIEQKAILSYFINGQTKTVHLDFQDGTVNDFVRYGILYRSSDVTQLPKGFAYSMHEWAWEYLNKHPELVMDEGVELLLQKEPRLGKPRPPIRF